MTEGLQRQELRWGSLDIFWNYCRANNENIIWGSPPFGIVYLFKMHMWKWCTRRLNYHDISSEGRKNNFNVTKYLWGKEREVFCDCQSWQRVPSPSKGACILHKQRHKRLVSICNAACIPAQCYDNVGSIDKDNQKWPSTKSTNKIPNLSRCNWTTKNVPHLAVKYQFFFHCLLKD